MVQRPFPLRCLIVDDNADFLAAARRVLECDELTVVGVATTCAAALLCVHELRPDVTLVDIDLGEDSGIDLAQRLHRTGSSARPPVILISTHAEQDFADVIATSPAVGFIAKSALSPAAIREVLDGSAGVQEGEDR